MTQTSGPTPPGQLSASAREKRGSGSIGVAAVLAVYLGWATVLYLREPVITYSSGMRARLAFAISMIIEFDCFLIDEISAVGDARFHDRCNFELFEKRADRAMIIISHDAAYVRDHCNRWGVLHDGRLVQYDDFEVAYADFKELIGWKPPPGWPHIPVATA